MSTDARQYCGTSERRRRVLDFQGTVAVPGPGGPQLRQINGIDFVEVLDDDAPSEADRQRLIDVTFLKPDGVADLEADNFVITGGVRITGIKVLRLDPTADSLTVRLRVDAPGDFSPYVLRLQGLNGDAAPANFDPMLVMVEFSFKADCPTDFDCLPPDSGPTPWPPSPAIDYLAKDYESFRRLMLDRMALTIPGWTERSPADLGVTLVETLAFGADMASYYQDAVASEAYLSRARLRQSARRHARLLGYTAGEGVNARTFVAFTARQDVLPAGPPVLPVGTMLLTHPDRQKGLGNLPASLHPDPERIGEILRSGVRVFETMEPLPGLRVARNSLPLYAWGASSCCLEPGATMAHVVGTLADTGLAAGDVLILEELIPLGGDSNDPPDPAHRVAVRLDRAPIEMIDPLVAANQPEHHILEVHWYLADALPFALNIAPGAARARGNVVLADDGRTLDFAAANAVLPGGPLATPTRFMADLVGRAALVPAQAPTSPDGIGQPRRFRPALTIGPVTRAVPYNEVEARSRPARDALAQDSAQALAAIELVGDGETWVARSDLLNSDRFAPEFVVETRNDGTAELRFGDNRFGRAPQTRTGYEARVRVGNGAAGRIGADAIGHVVVDNDQLIDAVTNPLPAVGGVDPQTLTAIQLNAPHAFRTQRRAVTAADYANFAEQHPDVQRAVAEWRWTGSWRTVFIAVDRRGGRPVDATFETDLRGFLEPFRLAGHDVEIEPPSFVPLDVALVVCVAAGHYAEHVEVALLNRFSSGLQSDGTIGFFNPDAFSFGQKVMLSPIVAAAMAVPGVRWVGTRFYVTTNT